MALFKIALVALAVAAASASGLRDSVHAALSTAVKPGRIAKQLKCTEDEATSSTSKDNCAACGCVACPCCISGGKGCPRTPIWKETEAVPKSLVNAKCSVSVRGEIPPRVVRLRPDPALPLSARERATGNGLRVEPAE